MLAGRVTPIDQPEPEELVAVTLAAVPGPSIRRKQKTR